MSGPRTRTKMDSPGNRASMTNANSIHQLQLYAYGLWQTLVPPHLPRITSEKFLFMLIPRTQMTYILLYFIRFPQDTQMKDCGVEVCQRRSVLHIVVKSESAHLTPSNYVYDSVLKNPIHFQKALLELKKKKNIALIMVIFTRRWWDTNF